MLNSHRRLLEPNRMAQQCGFTGTRMIVLDGIAILPEMLAVKSVQQVEHRRASDIVRLQELQNLLPRTRSEMFFGLSFHSVKFLLRFFRANRIRRCIRLESWITKLQCGVHPPLLTDVQAPDCDVSIIGS